MSGIGFTLVCGPLLFASFGPHDGVRVALVLSLLVNVAVLFREHRLVLWRPLAPVLAAALVTTPLVTNLVAGAAPRGLQAAAGAAILAGVAWVKAGRCLGGRTVGAIVAGIASATMNVVASASGPAVAVYATGARWDAARVRGTLQAYFLALNLTTLAAVGLPEWSTGRATTLVASLVAGSAAGVGLSRRVPSRIAQQATLALAAVGGLAIIVTALRH